MQFRTYTLLAAVAAIAALIVAVVLLSADNDQTTVEAKRGDPLPKGSGQNRSDDIGADVVRAYRQAADACSPAGTRLLDELSRPDDRSARSAVRVACARADGEPFAEHLRGEVAEVDLDHRGRSLWRVTAQDDELPDGMLLRVRQGDNSWEIDRACLQRCPA